MDLTVVAYATLALSLFVSAVKMGGWILNADPRAIINSGRWALVALAALALGLLAWLQAGGSPPGQELSARSADLVFSVVNGDPASAKAAYDALKQRVVKHGRAPADVPILPGVLGDGPPREHDVARSLQHTAAARGHWVIHGTPKRIADILEEWFTAGRADGFVIMPAYFPAAFDDFVDRVMPELQRRGLFRREYSGSTLRDHLGLTRPTVAPGLKSA
jgi:hypothetical protein